MIEPGNVDRRATAGGGFVPARVVHFGPHDSSRTREHSLLPKVPLGGDLDVGRASAPPRREHDETSRLMERVRVLEARVEALEHAR